MKKCATVEVLTVVDGARIEYDAALDHGKMALLVAGDKVKIVFLVPDNIEKPKVVKK